MTVEAIQTVLLAATGVTDIVGTRVFQVTRTEGTDLPCVVVTQTSIEAMSHLGGAPTLTLRRIQVDSFSATRTQCNTLATACRAAIEAAGGNIETEAGPFEPDVNEYRITQDFSYFT